VDLLQPGRCNSLRVPSCSPPGVPSTSLQDGTPVTNSKRAVSDTVTFSFVMKTYPKSGFACANLTSGGLGAHSVRLTTEHYCLFFGKGTGSVPVSGNWILMPIVTALRELLYWQWKACLNSGGSNGSRPGSAVLMGAALRSFVSLLAEQ